MDNKKPLDEKFEIIRREHELHDYADIQRNNNFNEVQLSETEKTVLHSALIDRKAAVDDLLEDDVYLEDRNLKEKFYESFWKILEILEGDEDGEVLRNALHLTHLEDITMEVDDIEMDPGMFHGFDDLGD